MPLKLFIFNNMSHILNYLLELYSLYSSMGDYFWLRFPLCFPLAPNPKLLNKHQPCYTLLDPAPSQRVIYLKIRSTIAKPS